MTERRVLLPPGVGRDEVDEAADALGWALVNVFARTEDRPRQVFFATPDGEGLVVLVDDHRIDARYLVASGHDPDAILERAVAHTGELDRAAVLALPDEDRVRRLAWVGVARPTGPDPAVKALLDAAADDPDPSVRAAAAFAREALGW